MKAAKSAPARSAVRIQAGKWKGRRLDVPAGARPTSGRARAAFFDLLGPSRLHGARVLDLYAGSGAVGFEAVSRGAASAALVDSDAAPIVRSCERMGAAPEEIRVIRGEAAGALARLARSSDRFDVVFVDPPYAGVVAPLDGIVPLLAPGGVLVVQMDAGEEVSPPRGLALRSRRAYGRNVFHFFGMD